MELPKGRVNSNINVTPLVDVVLVLLIIFMVVTPLLQRGPAVVLPLTREPAKQEEDKDQILVAIDTREMYHINQGSTTETTDKANFPGRIREWRERNPDSTVVIKGDARLTYGIVKEAMLNVKEAGYSQVGLITKKRDQEVPR